MQCCKKHRGLILTVLLAFALLFYYYGKPLRSINHVYFSSSGDGLQSYYTSLYHIKYDTSYSVFQGMNYPYGEHVMFTNCQPALSNTIKFISSNIVDISGYTVGLINLMMLLSLVLAAVFIYLVFSELKVNRYYAAIVAVGIAFLAPLVHRFSGHYSLSYVFTIPAIIYFVLLFDRKRSWKISLIIGLFLLLMSSFHAYNFAFSATLILFYWLVKFLSEKPFRSIRFLSLNLLLQIVLPIVILNLWVFFSDAATDRTAYPWGLLVYKSGWEGVFLQDQNIASPFLRTFIHTNPIEWEGWAYTGHIAGYLFVLLFGVFASVPFFSLSNFGFFLIVFLTGVIIHLLYKRKWNFFKITDNKTLNILMWAGLLTLLFSFAWPLVLFEDMIPYLGPIRQFRGIGRFSWVFYFILNIGAFYYLWKATFLKKYLQYPLLAIAVVILYVDANQNNNGQNTVLCGTVPELEDKGNMSEDNAWVKQINPNDYQAIIPLPYFHLGSESIWIDSKCNSMYHSYLASYKTGIPLTALLLSRNSLSQTYLNIAMILEPYRKLKILDDFSNKKPFLLMVMNCEELTQSEKNLISLSTPLFDAKNFKLYNLKYEALNHISDSLYLKTKNEIDTSNLVPCGKFLLSQNCKNIVSLDFDESTSTYAYNSSGSYSGNIREFNRIFEGPISNVSRDTSYSMSFWLGKTTMDLIPRTTIEIVYSDFSGNNYFTDYKSLQSLIKTIDDSWSLIEYPIHLRKPNDKLTVTLWNKDMKKSDSLVIDEFLIRPEEISVYKKTNGYIMKNNRFYIQNQDKK
jgi:hypothetical protein